MRAFSLRTLLIAMAVVALWLVILGRPSLFWMRVALTGTLATLGWWLVMAIATREDRRRFGVAAALFGIGYLAISLYGTERTQFQNSSYVMGRTLLTHQLLEAVAKVSGHGQTTTIQDISLWDTQMFSEVTMVAVPATAPSAMTTAPVGGFGGGFVGGGGGGFGGPVTFTAVPGPTPNARYQHYLISGHCLFALLIGGIAGQAARRWLKPQPSTHATVDGATNATGAAARVD